MTAPSVQPPGALVLAALAGAGHLGVGWFYLAGRRSWWTPVVPVLAAAVLLVTLVVGDTVLGWTA